MSYHSTGHAALKRFSMAALPFFFLTGALQTTAQSSDEDVEEVVVTGFRGSLSNAVDSKRVAKNITDSIFAEDIGKSSDQNIAEALSRVTGVSLTRTDGEGTSISIRGAAPNLNNISVNGIQLTSGGAPEASGGGASQDIVDLSAFSSDILSSIDVYKTASADLDEGSLGGTVILNTFRPLDASENRRSLEVQGRYHGLAKENDFKFSGSFSQKFADDTIGIHATVFSEVQSTRRDQIDISEYEKTSVRSDQVRDQHGNLLTSINEKGEVESITGLQIKGFNMRAFANERERVGGTFGFQFSPSEETNLLFDVTHSILSARTDNNSLTVQPPQNGEATREQVIEFYDRTINAELNEKYGDTNLWLNPNSSSPDLDKDGNPIDGYRIVAPSSTDDTSNWNVYNTDTAIFDKRINRYGLGRSGRNTSVVDTDNTVMSFEIEQIVGDLTFNFKAGYSKTDTKDDINKRITTNNFNTVSDTILYGVNSDDIEPIGVDCTSGRCTIAVGTGRLDPGIVREGENADDEPDTKNDNYVTTRYNPDDVVALHLQAASTRNQFVEDEAKSLYFDVDWDVDAFGFTTIEAGLKWSDREKDNVHGNIQFESNKQSEGAIEGVFLPRGVGSVRLNEVVDGDLGFTNFLSGLGYPKDSITDGWPSINAERAFELIELTDEVQKKLDNKDTRNIQVETSAIYLKANFAFLDDQLTGDIGVRYVSTDNASTGFSGVNYQNVNIVDLEIYNKLINKANPPCQATAGLTKAEFTDEIRDKRDAEAASTDAGCFDPIMAADNAWQLLPQDKTTPNNPEFSVVGEGSSDILLPSLNLNYDLTDDMVLRGAVSKTMARPKMDSLQPGFVFSESIWSGNGSGRIRNPNLQPLESKNFDLSFEYYFNEEGGLLAATYFHKDYSNFEETETIPGGLKDIRDRTSLDGSTATDFILLEDDVKAAEANNGEGCFPSRSHLWTGFRKDQSPFLGKCRDFQISRIINGKGATIDGLELTYQQNYDMLPGIWSGLGTAINLTFQQTKSDKQLAFDGESYLPDFPLANSPEETVNATVFWEQNGHLIRIAYNRTTDELLDRSFTGGTALWQEGGTSLDISANYKVNDWMDITFNAVNVTDRVTRQYATSVSNGTINGNLDLPTGEGSAFDGATKARTIREFNTGAIYRLGLRAKF